MVLLSYERIEDSYEQIKQAACGRQACSVVIMVAYEVFFESCLFQCIICILD